MNEGLRAFQSDLQEDPLAARRVEIAIVTFGGSVRVVQDFTSAGQFVAPALAAGGGTPMGEAILRALEMVKVRKDEYKANGVLYYQPWIFLITDGQPTDEWRNAAAQVRAEMDAKALTLFAVGTDAADMSTLSQITPRALRLDGLKFRELFIWLSQSNKRVAGSKPGDMTGLPQVSFGSPV